MDREILTLLFLTPQTDKREAPRGAIICDNFSQNSMYVCHFRHVIAIRRVYNSSASAVFLPCNLTIRHRTHVSNLHKGR